MNFVVEKLSIWPSFQCNAGKASNDLLVKLDGVCFTYQHVDCFYTFFKFRFSGNVLEKKGEIFDSVERAVLINKLKKRVDNMPSIAKNWLLRKKFRKHMTSVQRSLSVQTFGSIFVWRVKSVRRKTYFELQLMKNIDCFLDGYGGWKQFSIVQNKTFQLIRFSKIERTAVYQELECD